MNTDQVTRLEVIDHTVAAQNAGLAGRVLLRRDVKVTLSLQDDGRTLKVFFDSPDQEGYGHGV